MCVFAVRVAVVVVVVVVLQRRLLAVFCCINFINYLDRGAIASTGVLGRSKREAEVSCPSQRHNSAAAPSFTAVAKPVAVVVVVVGVG